MIPRAQPASNFQDTEKTTVFKDLRIWSTDSKIKTPLVNGMSSFRSPSQRSHTVVMATKQKTFQGMTYYFSSAFWKENCRSAGWGFSLSDLKGKTACQFEVHAVTEIDIYAPYLCVLEIKAPIHIHRIVFCQLNGQLITSKRVVIMPYNWHACCGRSCPLPYCSSASVYGHFG